MRYWRRGKKERESVWGGGGEGGGRDGCVRERRKRGVLGEEF